MLRADSLNSVLLEMIKTYHTITLTVPECFEKRHTTSLPGYHLRDDAINLWEILSNYVTDIVNLTYENDTEVASDKELQDFCQEVSIHYIYTIYLYIIQYTLYSILYSVCYTVCTLYTVRYHLVLTSQFRILKYCLASSHV